MNELYKEIPREDVARLIAATGKDVTILVEGHTGSGKTALLNDLALQFKDTHKGVYIDMTMLDIGDLQIPAVNHETRTTTFYPNEVLGLHEDRPLIIMFDEFGKAPTSVKNAVLPMLIERRMGNRKFHPDTMVFATTNLGAERVGDMFKPHERNRMTFVRMAKPNATQWLAWAADHDQAPEVMAWVHQNPHCFAAFDEYTGPDDNPYIYHPMSTRTAFVTHRSMAQASRIIAKRAELGDDTVCHSLCGTIGDSAAMDMMAFVTLGDTLPSRQSIIDSPATATIPDSPAGQIILIMQSYSWLTAETVDSWITYLRRFPMREAQALFACMSVSTKAFAVLVDNKQFTNFVAENGYLFS